MSGLKRRLRSRMLRWFSTRNRIFIGIVLIYVVGVGLLVYNLSKDIDPRYRESAEESQVESANLLAALVEQDMRDGAIDVSRLGPLFNALYAREFSAQIYSLHKTRVEFRAYVTDQQGVVLFDSTGRDTGTDYSVWRDVRLALKGEYGARTSRDVATDPLTSVMYVSVPIRSHGGIVGVAVIGKPVQSFGQFMVDARKQTLYTGALAAAATLLLALIVGVWLSQPFGLMRDFFRYIRTRKPFNLFQILGYGGRLLRQAYSNMRDALAGRDYVISYVRALTHEIRSPLSVIRGAVELLDEPMPEGQRQRFIGNIGRETQRIEELLTRMVELTMLESRRVLEKVESVCLVTLLEGVVSSAQSIGAAKGVEVRLVLPEDTSRLQVEGDRFLLQQAISNLLSNAIDFSPHEGLVEVCLSGERRGAAIVICDQGPGIPEYAQTRVFEKFYSLARPGGAKKSTGLGLAFVGNIVSLHQGKIHLQNIVDETGNVLGLEAQLNLPLVVV